jgi:hypothetical protein
MKDTGNRSSDQQSLHKRQQHRSKHWDVFIAGVETYMNISIFLSALGFDAYFNNEYLFSPGHLRIFKSMR